jgi:hypothetical protein
MMTDDDLDTLLATPLPERDAGAFSVALMEAVARRQARPARILAWIATGALALVTVAACLFGASLAGRDAGLDNTLGIPAILIALTLILSFSVMQSARE